ncbi:MAG: hypothetical protein MK132_20160 [Lentisphaerales bacterium]|nr:hypothetical protein [Lentisphaerales bacterium]
MTSNDIIGWVATSLFVASYFVSPKGLRLIQSSAAVLWIIYALNIDAYPAVAANVLICVISLVSIGRDKFLGKKNGVLTEELQEEK